MARKTGASKRPPKTSLSTAPNMRGYFVAFGYTKDAEREAAAFYKRTPPERIIKLLTVQEILDEEHVQKM